MDWVTKRIRAADLQPTENDEKLLKLKVAAEAVAEEYAEYGLTKDNVEIVRKWVTPDDLKVIKNERAVVGTITTNRVDRDGEVVDPAGAVLDDYRKNPVVMYGHDYHSLPIGKNIWVKATKDGHGLVAKTEYANHAQADEIYQYRKDGFPLGQSIGFAPIEWEDHKKGAMEDGRRRTYTKWALLEYSDVPIPANPDALQLAISKGWIEEDHAKEMGYFELDENSGQQLEEKEADEDQGRLEEKETDGEINLEEKAAGEEQEEEGKAKGSEEAPTEEGDPEGGEETPAKIDELGEIKQGLAALLSLQIAQKFNLNTAPSTMDITRAVKDAAEAAPPVTMGEEDYCWMQALYPYEYPSGKAVLNFDGSSIVDKDRYWLATYKYENEEAEISTWVRVEQAWVQAMAFAEEEIEQKAGRVLSKKTRKLLTDAAEALLGATEALGKLLEEADKKPEEEIPAEETKDSEEFSLDDIKEIDLDNILMPEEKQEEEDKEITPEIVANAVAEALAEFNTVNHQANMDETKRQRGKVF